jgi:tetratricopeptide (TPR) repeat protein
MESGQIIYPKRRRQREYAVKELVAKVAYSVIFVVLALIALRPLMVEQMLSRADAYSQFGLYDESKRQCNKALLLDDNNSQAWHKLARIHKDQGNIDMAMGAYQMATASDHENVAAHFEYGMLYVKDGQYKQAIPYFDRVRELKSNKIAPSGSPYHKSSLDMLMLCYEKVGDQAKVEFMREQMRVFYPHHKPADDDA